MTTQKKNIETQAAQTILEEPLTLTIGQKTYTVAPPTVATIIRVSEAVSRLPHLKLDPERVVEEVLAVGKDCRVLGEIAALLILGGQNSQRQEIRRQTGGKRLLWGLIDTRRWAVTVIDPKEELTEELLNNLSPHRLFEVISQILSRLELSDFFGVTTFLSEINLLHQTREVEN